MKFLTINSIWGTVSERTRAATSALVLTKKTRIIWMVALRNFSRTVRLKLIMSLWLRINTVAYKSRQVTLMRIYSSPTRSMQARYLNL